jgi:hypothetical protein
MVVFVRFNQGIRKVKSRSGVCYFYCKISVTSKYVINLIIQTSKHSYIANKIELSFGYTHWLYITEAQKCNCYYLFPCWKSGLQKLLFSLFPITAFPVTYYRVSYCCVPYFLLSITYYRVSNCCVPWRAITYYRVSYCCVPWRAITYYLLPCFLLLCSLAGYFLLSITVLLLMCSLAGHYLLPCFLLLCSLAGYYTYYRVSYCCVSYFRYKLRIYL